jgi:uncharacterized membrane protein
MNKFLDDLRKRIVAGFIFLIPLFAVILLLKKLWIMLTGAGSYLVQIVGLKSVLGSSSVPVATALTLIILFYFFGWLVKSRPLNRFRGWVESSFLNYIPGYVIYKAQMEEKVAGKKDSRMPVWVSMVIGRRPALLVEEREGESVVFFPNSPDSNNGDIMVVDSYRVSKLAMDTPSFLKSMQRFGKDLVLEEVSLKPV